MRTQTIDPQSGNGQVVTGWRWRGECSAAEERWH